jgi:hypothetical protein
VAHPSLPNYLAMSGGSTLGVTDDGPPSSHAIDQPSVFGQALSLGKTAVVTTPLTHFSLARPYSEILAAQLLGEAAAASSMAAAFGLDVSDR